MKRFIGVLILIIAPSYGLSAETPKAQVDRVYNEMYYMPGPVNGTMLVRQTVVGRVQMRPMNQCLYLIRATLEELQQSKGEFSPSSILSMSCVNPD